MTFVDAVVAQKVVNMREHSIRKSNLNVSFADPRGGGGGSGGMKSMPAFSTDPFNQMGYASHLASRFPAHQAGVAPRFPFPAQPQQPQAYSLGYGTPQHVAAVQRPDATQNPNAMVRMWVWSWSGPDWVHVVPSVLLLGSGGPPTLVQVYNGGR